MAIHKVRRPLYDFGMFWRTIPSRSNEYYLMQEHNGGWPKVEDYNYRILTTKRSDGPKVKGHGGDDNIGGGIQFSLAAHRLAATAVTREEIESDWWHLND